MRELTRFCMSVSKKCKWGIWRQCVIHEPHWNGDWVRHADVSSLIAEREAIAQQVKEALRLIDGKPVSQMTEAEKAIMMIDRSLLKSLDKTNA